MADVFVGDKAVVTPAATDKALVLKDGAVGLALISDLSEAGIGASESIDALDDRLDTAESEIDALQAATVAATIAATVFGQESSLAVEGTAGDIAHIRVVDTSSASSKATPTTVHAALIAAAATTTPATGDLVLGSSSGAARKWTAAQFAAHLAADATAMEDIGGAALVLQSGTGAYARTLQDWQYDAVSLMDFIPAAERAAIRAGTSTYDCGPSLQAALATLRPVHAPAGTYIIDTAVVVQRTEATSAGQWTQGPSLAGDGPFKTIFKTSVANNPAIYVRGLSDAYYFDSCHFSGFSIVPSGSAPINGGGLRIRGLWNSTITNVHVKGLTTGPGIEVQSTANGDAETSAHLKISLCDLRLNKYGLLAVPDGSGGVPLAHAVIDTNNMASNTHGGVKIVNGIRVKIEYNSIVTNGATGNEGGVLILGDGLTNRVVQVLENELGNNNKPFNIKFAAAQSSEIRNNRHISNSGETATTDLIELDSTSATNTNISILDEYVLVHSGINPCRFLTFTGSAGGGIRVVNPHFAAFGATGQVKFSGTVPSSAVIIDDNVSEGEVRKVNYVAPPSDPHSLDARLGIIRVDIALSSMTFGTPTNAIDGREIVLILRNAYGGSITVTWSAAWLVSGWVDPAATKVKTARFIYSSGYAQWIQIGQWSGDM